MLKRIIVIFLCLLLAVDAYAWKGLGWKKQIDAVDIEPDTTDFDNNLSTADDNLQKALETIDEMAGGIGGGAPTDVDYLVGTADGGLSNEIAVGTTPGGEIGGTWASPTIDDNVTVTGWVLGASTATTPAANDADTSLATTAFCETTQDYLKTSEVVTYYGGTNITLTGSTFDADSTLTRDTEWDSASEINAATSDEDFLAESSTFSGDVTGTSKTTVVGNDSHSHTISTLPFLDEDDFASNSDTQAPTQQSVKAYVDALPGAVYYGGTDITLTGSTFDIDSAVTRDIEWDTVSEINSATTDEDVLAESSTFDGDVTGTSKTTAVGNDSHTHGTSTISGLSLFDDIGSFPVDPNADRLLMWDDDPGAFAFLDYSTWDITAYTGGDFLTLTGQDFDVDTAAVSNGETTKVPTCDGVFDFCETTQAYLQAADLVGANEAYDATNWDSDTGIPEKDDIRDKLETMPQTAGNFITLTGTDLDVDAVDEDNMVSNSDTMLPTQQSVKAYADTKQTADADLTDLADGSLTASKVAGVADADYGDVTVSSGAWAVENDSHSHTITTIPYLDEDDMISNSDTQVPTQQSIKAYVDANAGVFSAIDQDNLVWSDGGSASLIWTWDLSGTDDVITFGSDKVTIGNNLEVANRIYIDASQNTSIGYQAGNSLDAYYNVFLGYQAGSNTAGNYKTCLGYKAGAYSNTNDTLIGAYAGQGLSASISCTAVGTYALSDANSSAQSANYCNAFGYNSLLGTVSGTHNSAFGNASGQGNTSGSNNCFFGNLSGQSNNGSGNIFLGFASGKNQTASSNILVIDNQDRSSAANEPIECMVYGTFNDDASLQSLTFNADVYINGDANIHDNNIIDVGNIALDTISSDAGDVVTVSDTLVTPNNVNILGQRHAWHIPIGSPNDVVTGSSTLVIVPLTDAALTVTKIEVTTSSASYEIAGDLKWADARIGLANATVINVFDTSSGVLTDSSITAGAVGAGKCVYLQFDAVPNAAMTDCGITVYWDYDS